MKIFVGYLAFAIIALLSIYAFRYTPAQATMQKTGLYTSPTDSTKPGKQVNNGIGPISKVKLGPIDKKLADDGEDLFNSKCIACHHLDNKVIGPPLRNITKQQSPVFIMNYLLNTTVMQQKDPGVKKLIKEYSGVVMPNQNLTKKQARSLLEYFRSVADKK